MEYHVPVMLKECMEGLQIMQDGIYVDATFGGGGHSREILNSLGVNGRLIAFDRDEDALANRPEDKRLTVIRANYKHMQRFLKAEGIKEVNGILADLGVSSYQLDQPERGFSFRFDEALDMRMDTSQTLTAFDVVNHYTSQQLQQVLGTYGEVRNARTLALHIESSRKANPITSTGELKKVVMEVLRGMEHKYLAQVFQAIRIEVNGELESLKEFLTQSMEVLAKGGRLVVMSYHSLEDRLVKNFIKKGVFEGDPEKDLYGNYEHSFAIINKKPIEPSGAEMKQNPRARSARLRIAEKI